VECDLLVLAADLSPAAELLTQAGARLRWDRNLQGLLPEDVPPGLFVAGGAGGTHALDLAQLEGELAGLHAARHAGLKVDEGHMARLGDQVAAGQAARGPWSAGPIASEEGRHNFLCLCEDVTRADIRQSVQEGYSSPELLKRYSTVSMGPCQGKMCNPAATHLLAMDTGREPSQIGATTSRPPARPVALGALAGSRHQPTRLTPIHKWHQAHGARMMSAGTWMRPEHYGDPAAEVRAVRERVGLIDVSTLGKLHLHGPDAAELLERIYTNRWQDLETGQARYGLMVDEEGVILDDGVTARLDQRFYYMTTTSSGAARTFEWIQWWLGAGWDLDVHVIDAVELRAAMNLAGPHAREVLNRVAREVDLSPGAFPYMAARRGHVAEVDAILLRIGFTGELGYEIHVPSGYALHVWETLMAAGREFGIQPFGVEAQRVLRLEKGHLIVSQDTDALSNPLQAGAAWAVDLDKADFLGKPSLARFAQRGLDHRLVGFEMLEGPAPEEGDQAVAAGEGPLGLETLGRVTSARWSPTLDKALGLCWLPSGRAAPGTRFSIRTRGALRRAQVARTPFYDPEGLRLRG
jgi:sarcosine oxidase subunit alpha